MVDDMTNNHRSALIAAIGENAVIDDQKLINVMAHDVYRSGGAPSLVLRPTSVEHLQEAVRICADADVAMIPRGGGASYTDGYILAKGGHVLFDLAALNKIDVDSANATVTVEAGATWAVLKEKLDELGLRTPFWGPFSGLAATVGGSFSQNTASHGGGSFGISAESALSIDVVLASGEILSTSSSKATRHFGCDLTGLFTGDCGALGIKARITLPLIAKREHFEALSFAFDDFASYHEADRSASRMRLDDTHFGLSKSLSQGQIGKQQGMGARLQIARDIMRTSSSFLSGIKQLVKMAVAGETQLASGEFMCHFIVEGMNAIEARAKAESLRAVVTPFGTEIVNSVPAFVRAMPFAPLTNILGPGGERWVPLHGILSHDYAVPFHKALMAFYAKRKTDMERLGVWRGEMFSPVGSSGFLYEIALYWPDKRTVYHEEMLDAEYLETLPDFEINAAATDYVDQLKRELILLYAEFEAAHFQIGRAYPYQPRLDPSAAALLGSIKRQLDPKHLMNPGVLGFS